MISVAVGGGVHVLIDEKRNNCALPIFHGVGLGPISEVGVNPAVFGTAASQVRALLFLGSFLCSF